MAQKLPKNARDALANQDDEVVVVGTVTVTGAGSAGVPDPGIITVQGIAGGTPVPVSGIVVVVGPTTVEGTLTNNALAPAGNNVGVLPAIANAAAPGWTEGRQVLLSVDLSGGLRSSVTSWLGSAAPTVGQKAMVASLPVVVASDQTTLPVEGKLTNNGAAPAGNNVGALGAQATAVAPVYTEGRQVLLSVDLSGLLRTNVAAWFGSSAPTVGQKAMAASLPVVIASDQSAVTFAGNLTNNAAVPAGNNVGVLGALANAAAPTYTEGRQVLLSVDLAGGLRSSVTAWFGATTPTVGQKAMAASLPVVIASDQTTINVQGALSNNALAPSTNHVGALTALANAAAPGWTEGREVLLSVDLAGGLRSSVTAWLGSAAPTVGQKAMAASLPVVIASDQTAVVFAGNLTNNSAVPAANHIGALTAVANAAAPTWTEGREVLLSVDLSGRQRIDNSSWIGSTAPTVGQKAMAASLPVVIASDQTAITATVSGGLTNNAAAPAANNLGVLGALANAAAPTWTEGRQVLLSVDLSGRQRVNVAAWLGATTPTVGQKAMAASIPVVIASDQTAVAFAGNLTNNAAAPAATNIGVLPALANAAAPTWTEGRQVLLSVDLTGFMRTTNPAIVHETYFGLDVQRICGTDAQTESDYILPVQLDNFSAFPVLTVGGLDEGGGGIARAFKLDSKNDLFVRGDETFGAYGGCVAVGIADVKDATGTTIIQNSATPPPHLRVGLPRQSHSDTFNAIAVGATIDVSQSGLKNFSIQVVTTGTVTAWSVTLEGSLDGTNFSTLGVVHATADGNKAIKASGTIPSLYMRANCTAITIVGGSSITATILGVQ